MIYSSALGHSTAYRNDSSHYSPLTRVSLLLVPATHILGVIIFLLMAGCVGAERTPTQSDAPQEEAKVVAPPTIQSTGQRVVKTDSPDAKTPTKVPAKQTRKQDSAASGSGKQEALPPLDLETLKIRLRETSAIGVFTKITLKNQVDDLLDQFRAHYQGRTKTSLAELRQAYDMLLLKVLSLLQDGDPPLARVIVASREAIWGILADPAKFATL
jgi:hypothetical protein